MSKYGHAGLFMAIIPLGIAQYTRADHDKALLARLRVDHYWIVFALLYYVLLLGVVIISLTRDVRVDSIGMGQFIVMMMFPIFIGMLHNDFQICLNKNRK